MSYYVKILESARSDLLSVFRYIAKDNPIIAKRFTNEIMEYARKMLSGMPKAGTIVKGKTRMLVYRKYVILYSINEKRKIISILHIFAKGRNWRA